MKNEIIPNTKLVIWFVSMNGGFGVAKILIVDDARFMRKTLTAILENSHYEVVGEAENGRQAVEMYRELQPDLVMMDITMPEMSGMEALRIIKKEFSDSKVIMCSAMGQQKMVVDAIEAGAKDFIVKPFDESRVIDAVSRVLA